MSAALSPLPAGGRSGDGAAGLEEALPVWPHKNPSPGSAKAPSPTSLRRGEVTRGRATLLRFTNTDIAADRQRVARQVDAAMRALQPEGR